MEQNQSAASATSDNVTQTSSVLASAASETKTQETTTVASVDQTAPRAEKFNELLDTEGRFINDWTNRLPEQLKDHTKTLSKFKSPIELMTSYASLEKEFSKRAEKVKLPGDDATEEEWNAYKQAIGAPLKPEDYGLQKPQDVDDANWDNESMSAAASVASKYGIPKKALTELLQVHKNALDSMVQRGEEYQKQQYEEVMSTLKKDMGVNLTTNLQRANRAAAALGLDPTNPTIGNNVDIIKALVRVDELLGEDKVRGRPEVSTSTYQEQYDALLKSDAYQGKKGLEAQLEAQNKLMNLHKAMGR